MIDKHINERHGNLTIIARSKKPANGYLYYYWCKCDCGNIKRYRYDQARKNGNCGQCEDFNASNVVEKLKGLGSGKE
ncbi:MAG: hypothetical protein J6R88_00050 [Clostridia bacterium]|nr:hypothetical protein [Clostridia bacterium]